MNVDLNFFTLNNKTTTDTVAGQKPDNKELSIFTQVLKYKFKVLEYFHLM